jgi:hypothetical protein
MDINFKLSLDILQTDRETYGLFDFLGDVGGLRDLLFVFVGFFCNPFAL